MHWFERASFACTRMRGTMTINARSNTCGSCTGFGSSTHALFFPASLIPIDWSICKGYNNAPRSRTHACTRSIAVKRVKAAI